MSRAILNIGIVGASGYTGYELLRLLHNHPSAKVKVVSSLSNQGREIDQVHSALGRMSHLKFVPFGPEFYDLDLVFVALPHGEAMPVVNQLWQQKNTPRIIDLSSDFRLEAAKYEERYGLSHLYPELIKEAVYGTPEISRERVQSARLVANPGCFAHCCILALAPLALAGALNDKVSISAVTGSTGSGAALSEKTHHPKRNESFAAYQVLSHRHVPEIEGALLEAARGNKVKIQLVPHSGPFSRGIFATCFTDVMTTKQQTLSLYEEFSKKNSFVRLRRETPKLLDVRGSNFCDVALFQDEKNLVVLAAIDNLVKGAAGNAVQCMNLMFGLDEESGLTEYPWAI